MVTNIPYTRDAPHLDDRVKKQRNESTTTNLDYSESDTSSQNTRISRCNKLVRYAASAT